MKPSFFSVARRPKWIAGLLIAFLVAGTFAALMQWQFARTFNTVGVDIELDPVAISELAAPGSLVAGSYDRLVLATVTLDPANSYVISDRLQLAGPTQVEGYWMVVNSIEKETGASLTLAVGFASELETALQTQLPSGEFDIVGYLEPSEPVRQAEAGTLGSVALSQLVNLYAEDAFESFPAYVVVQEGLDVEIEKISIGIQEETIEINWLTAFYAVEWLLFGLAAFYLWWRLVMDQVARESQLPELGANFFETKCKRTISETDKGVSGRAQATTSRVDQGRWSTRCKRRRNKARCCRRDRQKRS